jgi:hypothetical protein
MVWCYKRGTFNSSCAVLLMLLPALAAAAADNEKRGSSPPSVFQGPVQRAACGPNDRVETGLQGQTTVQERLSGASELPYNCNLELVGQVEGPGSKWQLTFFDKCAYFGTDNNFDNPLQPHPGAAVVDVSHPSKPVITEYLTSRAMLDPHESLKVNERRRMLGAVKGPGFGPTVQTDRQFAFYDLSEDCAHPRLLSDVEIPGAIGHAGDFAPDGRTYYATQSNGIITALDITDATNPKLLGFINRPTHDLSVSEDGTRMYLAQPGNYIPFGATSNFTGLVIVDVSDFQHRRPGPQTRVVGAVFWPDGGFSQQTLPVTINGRKHIIFTDETGPGPTAPASAARIASCSLGLPPFGFARIIDIEDETQPVLLSKLKLEVHDPANCSQVLNDFAPDIADFESYGYSSHYCSVDRKVEPRMLACGYLGAGLRVFDIRNPREPREIAYYKPGARRTEYRPGSAMWSDYKGRDRTTDRVQTNMRFVKYRGETHIQFVSQDGGFQIVRFTKPLRELLERRSGKAAVDED